MNIVCVLILSGLLGPVRPHSHAADGHVHAPSAEPPGSSEFHLQPGRDLAVPSHAHPVAAAVEALNPQLALHANSIFRLDDRRVVNDAGDPVDDRFSLREVEINLRATVAGFAEGVLIFTSEAESPGEYETGLEEGYLSVTRFFDIPPGPIDIKAGRFRPEFGRLNEQHTHEQRQTVRPRSFASVLGEEGFSQDGVQLGVGVGSDRTGQRFRVSSALINGGDMPLGEDNGGENIAFTVHTELSCSVAEGHWMEAGASTWQGRNDARGSHTTGLYGVDLTYEWRPHGVGRPAAFAMGCEGYYTAIDEAGRPDSSPVGGFAWAEYACSDRTSISALIDFFESPSDDRVETTSAAIYANYRFDSSLRLRIGVDRVLHSDDRALNHSDTVYFELGFTIGSAEHRH